MAIEARWTHAHSIQIEFPDRILSVGRVGSCISVVGRQNSENWFHFAIPTTVIINDRRLRTGSVSLRFRTNSDNAFVHAVHIYDGESKLAGHDNLRLSPRGWTLQQFDVPDDPEIRWGLGISIGIRFQGANPEDNRIEFSSAGCDFIL